MPTVLVTGATGLLGSHVVERFVAEGWQVRALVRDPAAARWLEGAGAELHAGDVLDAAAFARAARGCDTIAHGAAAIFSREGWEGYRRANVAGTANAIDAAVANGTRLVQVSSVAVYGPGTRYRADGRKTDEDTPFAPLPGHGLYARSKRESEELVLRAHRGGRIWATAVRPSVIYGRRDRQFTPRIARLVRRGIVPLVASGRSTMSLVHAANVADGVYRAAITDAAGGRAYNLADDFPVTVRDFFRYAAEGLGVRVRFVPVPLPLARVGAVAVGAIAPLLGIDRSVASARTSLDFVTRDNPFTSQRARAELGWSPAVRPAEGVVEAFRWVAAAKG